MFSCCCLKDLNIYQHEDSITASIRQLPKHPGTRNVTDPVTLYSSTPPYSNIISPSTSTAVKRHECFSFFIKTPTLIDLPFQHTDVRVDLLPDRPEEHGLTSAGESVSTEDVLWPAASG